MIEIGKKAPKARRSPQRSRERLPPESDVSTARRTNGRRDSDSIIGSEDHDVQATASKFETSKRGQERSLEAEEKIQKDTQGPIDRRYGCAQAPSVKPSVQATASKFETK